MHHASERYYINKRKQTSTINASLKSVQIKLHRNVPVTVVNG